MPYGRPEKIEVNDQVTIVWLESHYLNKIVKVTMIKRKIYTVKFRDSCEALFYRNHFVKHYEDSSSDEVQYDSDRNELETDDGYNLWQNSDGVMHEAGTDM